MNNIHNNGPDDKLLNDELEDLGHSYQQLSSDEPPELLDQAILNSAHRAVASKDRWLDFGWVHGLTTAAVIVLALTVILTQREPVGLEVNGVSKDALHTRPAASAPQPQAGSRTGDVAARESQDDFRAKKTVQSEAALREQDMVQEDSPVDAVISMPASMELAEKLDSKEAYDDQIDAAKTDVDKAREELSAVSSAETRLQAILTLKQAGDDRWREALKAFTKTYPDYPLPDELKD